MGSAQPSTTRITRQFRSLRTKCASLNTLGQGPSKPTVAVTYGSHRTYRDYKEESPPLAILRTFEEYATWRGHFASNDVSLAKRIYEVRDAFKNIVQAALGPPAPRGGGDAPRVMSLANMCATVVGEQIQDEIQATLDEQPEGDTNEQNDELRAQTMEELYEAVPSEYRPYTAVAHALSYILEVCAPHVSLFNALLEVCIAHGLARQSRVVLRELLSIAIRPIRGSAYACPLSHPAHSHFLTTLRRECCGRGSPMDRPSPMNNQVFAGTVIAVLTEPSPGRMHAWPSRAVRNLGREFRDVDFAGCFVPMCTALALSIGKAPRPRPPKKGAKAQMPLPSIPNVMRNDSLDRLARWANTALHMLHAYHSPDQPPEDEAEAATEALRAVIEFLKCAVSLRFHISDEPSAAPSTCVADALICLSAYILASPHASSLPAADLDALQGLIQDARVSNTSFDGLVAHVFPPPPAPSESDSEAIPTPPPPLVLLHAGGMLALDTLAQPLRARSLMKAEAALWAFALQHVEDLIAAPRPVRTLDDDEPTGLSVRELGALRRELVDRVEGAEARCYGDPAADEAGKWRWEDCLSEWILKSPLLSKIVSRPSKKRKIDEVEAIAALPLPAAPSPTKNGQPAQPDARYTSSDDESSDGTPTIPVSAWSNRPRPRDIKMRAELRAKKKAEKGGGERRTSDFSSLLADSHRNVISLRGERAAAAAAAMAAKRARPATPSDDDYSLEGDHYSDEQRAGEPSSDDALDLFAYPDSPVVARKRARNH